MKFIINRRIFKNFAGIKIGVLVIQDMDNSGHDEDILRLLRDEEKHQQKILAEVELGNLPEVAIWRSIYRDFGSKPRKYTSSLEALLRRARVGKKPLPNINNLVNLYNYISLKYHLPVGAEDLDKVEGNIELTIAKGNEKGRVIGAEKEEVCYQGEVIYKDAESFICRRWNWREADRTKIEKQTKNAVLVVEKAPGLDEKGFNKALDDVRSLIKKHLKGKVELFVLDKDEFFFQISVKAGERKILPINIKVAKPTKPAVVAPDIPQLFTKITWETGDSLSYKLKQIIFHAFNEAFEKETQRIRFKDIMLEHPSYEKYGDYSTNISLRLASELKKNPVNIAEKIVYMLNNYINKQQTITIKASSNNQKGIDLKPSGILRRVEIAGQGFINLWLKNEYLINLMLRVIIYQNTDITTQTRILDIGLPLRDKKIMVEFAHPNTHKEFHIGHLRNISIGESIVRILEVNGAVVFRANYQGDVGLHVAKAVWGVKKKVKSEKLKINSLRKLTPQEKAKFLGEAYALGSQAYEKDEKAKNEIVKLNIQIYKDPSKLNLWKETREWSLEYFDTVYNRVGSRFDRLFFESEVEETGRKIVISGVKKGVFIKDKDGSIYFPGKKYGLNNCVFVTRENYATYEGKEIALEELQYKIFPYDLSINNVANEQINFFQLGYKATEVLFPRHRSRHFHLAHGMVNLKSGKMSSRTGDVITANWLIDEAKKKIYKIIEQSKPRYTKDEQEEIAERVALSAVKYSMLKVAPKMDISFDLKESVSFEGDSGPYLQYTYARCKSVIRKSGKDTSDGGKASTSTPPRRGNQTYSSLGIRINPEELALLRIFYRFPEVVVESARNIAPNHICGFLYELARKYNLFYNKHSILKPESGKNISGAARSQVSDGTWRRDSPEAKESIRTFRLALTKATATILKQGLYLLGIKTVERM